MNLHQALLSILVASSCVSVHAVRADDAERVWNNDVVGRIMSLKSGDGAERHNAAMALSECGLHTLVSRNKVSRDIAVALFGEMTTLHGKARVLEAYHGISALITERKVACDALFAMRCFRGTWLQPRIINEVFESPLIYEADVYIATMSLIRYYSERIGDVPFLGISDKNFKMLCDIADGKDRTFGQKKEVMDAAMSVLAGMARNEHARIGSDR